MLQRFMLLLLLGICLKTPAEEILDVYTEIMPPFNYQDKTTNKSCGFSVDLVKELLCRTDIKINDNEIKIYPWTRAYKKVLNGNENLMLFSMTRTEEREKLFKWVGPIAPRTVWLWKLKSRGDVVVNCFEDAKKYTVGGIYNFAISNYLKNEGFNVEMNTSIDANYLKLFSRRIDIGTALEMEAAYYMKKHGRKYSDLEKLIKLDDRYSFYLALSRNTSDEIIMKLQKSLDRMKEDGSYDEIYIKYF